MRRPVFLLILNFVLFAFFSPFSLAQDSLGVGFDDRYEELLAHEKIIQAEQDSLVREHQTAGDLHQALEEFFNLPESLRNEKKSQMENQIAVFNQKQKLFQHQLDKYTIKQLDYFMERTHHEMNEAVHQGNIKKSALGKINGQLAKLNNSFQKYQDNRFQYGQPKDKDRMYPFRDFFVTARSLADQIKEATPKTISISETNGACESSKKSTGGFFKNLNLIGPALCALPHALFPSEKAGSTPLVEKFETLYRKYGENLGYKFHVNGQENLRPSPGTEGKKKITFVAGSHRDDVDAMAITHLGLQDHFIFFAAYNALPTFLAKFVDHNSNEVMVPGGDKNVRKYESPLIKLNEKLEKDISRTILIFPQGSEALINEIHPPREKTVWEALMSQQDKNYEVEIIPFSLDISPKFLSDNGEEGELDDQEVDINVSPKITPAMYQLMVEASDPQVINRYLRAVWTENTHKYPHMKNGEFTRKVRKHITGKLNGGGICDHL